ncbi:hypothetical protein CR194_04995 [Salipaludibacillus keqinensis]|uniref:Phage conserved hypothetical protein C-terminal domain-containing protein n=2 Tax=Salipaludibacillus keqinensis TaxID=2045207 RepID=A0A323TKA9_9BACI|nr:hypothetical protein CR194_04995 [Salipaludibacillus keqinensis]
MTNMAPSSIRRYLAKLINAGWIDQRSNPKIKWDRTKQYRVNLIQIQKDLNQIGLYLEGYKVEIPLEVDPAEDDQDLIQHEANEVSNEELPFSDEERTYEDEPTEESTEDSPKEPSSIPYAEIITYLNEQTDKNFKPSVRKTQEKIRARWQEKHRLQDFQKVIDTKTAQWINDPSMNKFLRPETLFGTKFEAYLNEGDTSKESAFDLYVKGLE